MILVTIHYYLDIFKSPMFKQMQHLSKMEDEDDYTCIKS